MYLNGYVVEYGLKASDWTLTWYVFKFKYITRYKYKNGNWTLTWYVFKCIL